MRRHGLGTLAASIAMALAAGCSADPQPAPRAQPTTTVSPSPAAPTCTPSPDDLRSFAPTPQATADVARTQTIHPDRLVVGVSADTYLMSFRDRSRDLVGFDIEVLRAVAAALFGDPGRIEFRVIPLGERINVLRAREVDIVGYTMTINCERWQQVNFSTQYVAAAQRLLVRADTPPELDALDELAGRRVCATRGGTAFETIARNPQIIAVPVVDRTDCLVHFQQGTADAIVSDDIVLAGFAAQDPGAKVVGEPLTGEPYGLAVDKANVDLTRFVNGVLEEYRRSSWQASYDRWLAPQLGPAQPPPPAYGREP